jgi:short-subunit dehydrogenase involved in D-alanine esterification of teichoic acids
VSEPNAIPVLFEAVIKNFSALNVLINNAGIMRQINLLSRKNETQNDAWHNFPANFARQRRPGAKKNLPRGMPPNRVKSR